MLFAALSRPEELSLGEFNSQGCANTVWACAAMDRSDELVFAALVRASSWGVGEFNTQELANTA